MKLIPSVEEALRLLIRTRGRKTIRRLRGKVAWERDLEASVRVRSQSDAANIWLADRVSAREVAL